MILRILKWMDNFGRGWLFEPHEGWDAWQKKSPRYNPNVAYYRTTMMGGMKPVYKRVPAKVKEARFRAFQDDLDRKHAQAEKDRMSGGVPF